MEFIIVQKGETIQLFRNKDAALHKTEKRFILWFAFVGVMFVLFKTNHGTIPNIVFACL